MSKVDSKTTEPEIPVPTDQRKALGAVPLVKTAWEGLTPIARRDFVTWVEGAKQAETRTRRIEKACDMLAKGKRRPCCYAVVPMNFYKALGESPRAKAMWGELTPNERRDFVAWVELVKDSEARAVKIAKACDMLAKGKRSAS